MDHCNIYRTLSVLIFMLFAYSLTAQDIQLSGYMIDSADMSPLYGSIVKIKTTQTGTATKEDGSYQLNCRIGDTIEVLSIGMKTVYWPVDSSSDESTTRHHDFYLHYSDPGSTGFMPPAIVVYGSSFSLAPTLSFRDAKKGAAFSYTYWFTHFYGYYNTDWSKLLRSVRINGTFAISGKRKIVFPQLMFGKAAPVSIGKQSDPIFPFIGLGYYWILGDQDNTHQSSPMLSANVQLWSRTFSRSPYRITVSSGYNWFVNNHRYDYFYIGINIYPFGRLILPD